jgi:hypothetical protein
VRAALGGGELSGLESAVVRRLEEYVVWAGKYTVPMKAELLFNDETMSALRQAPADQRRIIRGLFGRLAKRAAG